MGHAWPWPLRRALVVRCTAHGTGAPRRPRTHLAPPSCICALQCLCRVAQRACARWTRCRSDGPRSTLSTPRRALVHTKRAGCVGCPPWVGLAGSQAFAVEPLGAAVSQTQTADEQGGRIAAALTDTRVPGASPPPFLAREASSAPPRQAPPVEGGRSRGLALGSSARGGGRGARGGRRRAPWRCGRPYASLP